MLQHHAGLQGRLSRRGHGPGRWRAGALVVAAAASRWPAACRSAWPASDLVPALFEATDEEPLTVYLLGAAPGVAERAAANIRRRWPAVEVVGTYSPPLGFEKDTPRTCEFWPASPTPGPTCWSSAWVHRSRSCGCISTPAASRPASPCASGRRSTFWPARSRGHRVWMRDAGLEWLYRVPASRDGWPPAMPTTPGSFRSCSPANGGTAAAGRRRRGRKNDPHAHCRYLPATGPQIVSSRRYDSASCSRSSARTKG